MKKASNWRKNNMANDKKELNLARGIQQQILVLNY